MKSWKSNQLNHVTSEETEAQRGVGTQGSFLTSAVLCTVGGGGSIPISHLLSPRGLGQPPSTVPSALEAMLLLPSQLGRCPSC